MTSTAVVCIRKIAVLDGSDKHLYWATEEQARHLIREGEVDVLGTKKRVHAVRLRRQPQAASGAAGLKTGTQYSHRRETVKNPPGCWTLVEIPKSCRTLFTAVLDQCVKKAA